MKGWQIVCGKIAGWTLIDLAADVGSIGLLGWATYTGLKCVGLITVKVRWRESTSKTARQRRNRVASSAPK